MKQRLEQSIVAFAERLLELSKPMLRDRENGFGSEAIDGFIDNERFEGKRTKGRVLSLSTWRDEKAVVRWRTQGQHHSVQEKGRFEIFEDYRLRVGEVTDDTDPPRGLSVVEQRFDETANPQAKAVSISELTPSQGDKPKIAAEHLPAQLGLGKNPAGLINHEVFESIYNPGKLCFSLLGGMPKRPGGGHQSQLQTLVSSATDASASFATTA
jgi:heme-degrading monooxygenase HmoA